nr:MAG TPA: hypothetical protein [Caudoviricetes sp.]
MRAISQSFSPLTFPMLCCGWLLMSPAASTRCSAVVGAFYSCTSISEVNYAS